MTGNTVQEPVYVWWSPDGITMVPVTAANPFPVSLQGSGGSSAVTIADGADVTEGAKANAAATDSTSSWSVVALLKGVLAQLLASNPVQTFVSNTYQNITTKTTTTVKSGAGTLSRIIINKVGSADTIAIFDNTAGSGTLIGTITSGLEGNTFAYDCAFATGLTIVTGGTTAGDYTVVYR